MKTEEGKIGLAGHQIWYRRVGSGGVPLLALHGGPGGSYDYLEPLEQLAADRTVVFYDQLGGGQSDKPDDPSLWRIERFAAEIDTVRQALGLTQIHLLGRSWGGWLAIEYILSHPHGVKSLILASTSSSVPQYLSETTRLTRALPPEIYQTMQRYNAAEDYQHPDYQAAVFELYKHHMCRLDFPWPDPLMRLAANLNGNAVYETMWGPNEFVIKSDLKNWDRTDRLGEISIPTLITLGRYDLATLTCAETMDQDIPDSRIVIFEESAHVAHLEETDRYLQVLTDFMAKCETPGV